MHMTLAYFGPETLLPATSIIATVLGFILLVGRGSYRLALRAVQTVASRSNAIANTSTPHYDQMPVSHGQQVHASTQSFSVGTASEMAE